MNSFLHPSLRSISTLLVLGAALAGPGSASAQQILPREEALKYASVAALLAPPAAQLPLRVDADLKQPVAGHDEDYGVLLLPDARLSAAALEKVGAEVVPIGQLWLRKLTPMVDGAAVGESRLLLVNVRHEGESARVPLCLLGARRTSAGTLELVVYGKGTEPLTRVELRKAPRSQSLPLEISAERDYDRGRLTLHVAGQYAATLSVTELPD